MSQEQLRHRPPLLSQIDVSQASTTPVSPRSTDAEQTLLLRNILAAQDRQNELLEELISQMSSAQRQRASELGQWKQANPLLVRRCRAAAEALGRVQTEFLETMTNEINENSDSFLEGDFLLNDFIDRYGPRMAHLNGLLQVLAQLGAGASPPAGSQSSS
ncbi:MAG: hypothetical protein ACOY3P_18020 [Planctomycetota bacterium]